MKQPSRRSTGDPTAALPSYEYANAHAAILSAHIEGPLAAVKDDARKQNVNVGPDSEAALMPALDDLRRNTRYGPAPQFSSKTYRREDGCA